MVNLKWTPRLEKAFRKLQSSYDLNTGKIHSTAHADSLAAQIPHDTVEDDKATLTRVHDILETDAAERLCVEMDLVKQVSGMLLMAGRRSAAEAGQKDHSDAPEDWVNSMVKGSSVYFPKLAPKERDPALEKLMDGFRAQVAEKEYQRMISSIEPNATVGDHIRQDIKDLKDVKAHAIGIVNVLYTGGAVFTAVFMISAHFTQDLGKRVLLAFLGFILIVICEAYLYSRHASMATQGPRKKTSKKLPDDFVITTKTFSAKKAS